MQSSYLTARETAERLGVKLDTLYAYVSRGLLRSVAMTDSRERHYSADEVERFLLGRRADRAREALMPVIDTGISLIDNGRFYYRGADALTLADAARLEDVAALLWGGDIGEIGSAPPPHPFSIPACGERVSAAKRPAGEREAERQTD